MGYKGSNIEQYGFFPTCYSVFRKISEDTKSSKSLELGIVLSILTNLTQVFDKTEYGTRINITYLSDILQLGIKVLRRDFDELEKYGYIKTQIVKNTKYFKVTPKGIKTIGVNNLKNKKED